MTRDGAPLTFTRETIKGVEYAFFASTTGAYTASYGADTTAPAITARTAVPAADGTATVTWTTDEASDSRVDYGTSAASLTLNKTDAARVTAHSVQLTGLTPGTTYHYRVRSADAAGNATTQPEAPAAPGTFRIPQTVTATPAAATIDAGTLRAGAASALSSDDDVYYQVNSTTSGTRTSSFYGSFTGVPTNISSLTATYRGRNSVSCTQVIQIWRVTDGTWQQLNSAALGNTETTRGPYTPTGAAANYVSPTGEVRVRVRCTTTANFFASGELMQITYVAP